MLLSSFSWSDKFIDLLIFVMYCLVLSFCFFCCLVFSVFSLHRRSMAQHTGEAKDEEHRKKLEDLIQQVPDRFDFAFGTSLGLSCCTSMPSCDFIYLATSAVSKRWKMRCCHGKYVVFLAEVWSILALNVFLQEVERQSQADLEALQEGFMRSVQCRYPWSSPTEALKNNIKDWTGWMGYTTRHLKIEDVARRYWDSFGRIGWHPLYSFFVQSWMIECLCFEGREAIATVCVLLSIGCT